MSESNETADDYDEEHDELPGDGDDVEYLFAQTSAGIVVGDDGRITMTGVSPSTLFFSDRPYRVTGHTPTEEFVAQWDEGGDSFGADPPNAVLSLFEAEHVNDVVVVLSDPQLVGGDLSYAVDVTDGDLSPTDGPASLFIDRIGRPMTPMSVAGVRRRGRRRGRRRARRRIRR